MIHRVQNKFHRSRDSELVEDAKEVFLHRVLAKGELLRNLFVGKALGDQGHHLFFTRSKQSVSLGAHYAQRRYLRDEVEQLVNLLGARPDVLSGSNGAR